MQTQNDKRKTELDFLSLDRLREYDEKELSVSSAVNYNSLGMYGLTEKEFSIMAGNLCEIVEKVMLEKKTGIEGEKQKLMRIFYYEYTEALSDYVLANFDHSKPRIGIMAQLIDNFKKHFLREGAGIYDKYRESMYKAEYQNRNDSLNSH